MKKILFLLIFIIVFMSGCDQQIDNGDGFFSGTEPTFSIKEIDLNCQDGDLYIRTCGTYYLTGTLDGSIIIDAGKSDNVELVLAGACIQSSDFTSVYAAKCGRLVLNLLADTENYMSDSCEYVQIDDKNVDACVFVKSNLIVTGSGKLSIDSCAKGIVSKGDISILSGNINIDCEGDCIKGKQNVEISDGILILKSDDDAVHADVNLDVSGGDITVLSSDESLQGQFITLSGGNLELHAQDDGINANDSSEEAFGWGKATSTNASITIQGGNIHIIAGGDGLDSNGFIRIAGGTTVIDGPAAKTDTAFDYEVFGEIDGGVLFGISSSAEAVPVSESSSQTSFIIDLHETYPAETKIVVNHNGINLFEHISAKPFSCVMFSSPELKIGDNINVQMGDDVVSAILDSINTNNLEAQN